MTQLTRDGHLSDLALERVLAGEVDAAEHLEVCAVCRKRVDEARAFQPVGAREPARPWGWVAGAVALAAGIVAAVMLTRTEAEPRPEFVARGGFSFEIHAHDGQASRAVDDGSTVHPGERIGFRVAAPRPGELLVFGRDATGETYLCYPQGGGGASAPLAASDTVTALDEAIRLDDVLGTEQITAVFCSRRFTLDELGDTLPDGCAQRRVSLDKKAR